MTIISLFKRMNIPAFALDEKVCLTFITENDYNLKGGRVRLLPILWKAYAGLKKFLKAKPNDLIIAQCFLPALLIFLVDMLGKVWYVSISNMNYINSLSLYYEITYIVSLDE